MFNRSVIILCFIVVCLFSCQVSFAQNASLKESVNHYNVTFYTGTLLKAILLQRISTEVNNIGDKVELITPTDINLGEIVCIPRDTKFIGKIIKLDKPKVGTNGSFQLLFETMRLPEGQDIKIFARVSTKKGDGLVGGEATKRATYRPIVHRVEEVGNYIQPLPAGPREMGKDTELLPGTEVVIVLDKQVVLSVDKE